MKWPDGKPYYSLNQYYRELFGEKTYKLALDIGSTCPNRDGTLSHKGCIYCSEQGSGDFAVPDTNGLSLQISEAIGHIGNKYDGSSFIAYLQSYTNTYGDTDHLLGLYQRILAEGVIAGLAIATRPDCLEDRLIEGLKDLSSLGPIWIELGLQTIHPTGAAFINRCYDLNLFEDALHRLHTTGIPVIVHLIAGLPTEGPDDFLESVRYLNHHPVAGVKFHMLHILKHTSLALLHEKESFQLWTQSTYVDTICDGIAQLNPDIVIHRLTGDGPKDALIEPLWTLNKRGVLNDIHKTLKSRQIWQGKTFTTGGTDERQ